MDRAEGRGAVGHGAVRSRPDTVVNRRDPWSVATAEDVRYLRMDVPPLAHPGVAQVMRAAEGPQAGLAQGFELRVIGVPDVQEREKI